MNRKQIIKYCNDNIFPLCDWKALDYSGMMEAVRLVSRARIGMKPGEAMTASVNDGFLFLNGKPAGRIAPKAPRIAFSERGYYYEGAILARAEQE